MTNVDSQRIKEIRDNTRAMAEAVGRIADALAEALELYVSTQTETQNSNLTFETLEYCDICDHKGCEECIANALDEHCMPTCRNCRWSQTVCKIGDNPPCHSYEPKTEPQTERSRR